MQVKLNILSDKTITRETPLETLLTLLLKNRQITSSKTFLNPPFPEFELDSTKAIKLIQKYIDMQKNILIYGDYDVDGLTSTAILWQSLYPLNKNIIPFIPHRETDGYGFKASSFFRLEKEKNINFNLLITVDNGIVADAEFAKIKKKYPNIKILVIDHHIANGKLKNIDALFHSVKTSAAALAYFVAKNFSKSADLSLAALGVVADCQPLLDINRSLVVHGLIELKLNPSPGLKKLLEISGAKIDNLSVYDLGFLIGPRLNAVGRLSDPTDALRLLCSRNATEADKYAKVLNSFNTKRQDLQKESLESADKNIDIKNKVVFIADDYNPGIIGLIAGRLTEKYSLPSIIIAKNGEVAKGSCRSIPEVNIIEVLRKYNDLFVDLGGHPGAAGFSILDKNIHKLKKKLLNYFSIHLLNYSAQKSITIDAKMDIDAINLKNIKLIKSLEPFGIGNSQPLFLFENLIIESKKILGQNQSHLKLKVSGIDAIAFKKADLEPDLKIGDSINLVAYLDANTWNSHTFPQLIVKEIIKQ
ncbi:MAG TPA: DHHA1 domain-containing protein [Candidatus Methanoperedens sp.]|nr:DHHA1 domain-containing protein [Candidatus Methanoperedens sp.]